MIKINDPFKTKFQNLASEIQNFPSKLNLPIFNSRKEIDPKSIRKSLHEKSYQDWSALPYKGRGAVVFGGCPIFNKKINNLDDLIDSEFKECLKMVGDIAPVRGVHGRSNDSRLVELQG